MSQPLLSVNGLMMRFGGLLAVNNVSLELRERKSFRLSALTARAKPPSSTA